MIMAEGNLEPSYSTKLMALFLPLAYYTETSSHRPVGLFRWTYKIEACQFWVSENRKRVYTSESMLFSHIYTLYRHGAKKVSLVWELFTKSGNPVIFQVKRRHAKATHKRTSDNSLRRSLYRRQRRQAKAKAAVAAAATTVTAAADDDDDDDDGRRYNEKTKKTTKESNALLGADPDGRPRSAQEEKEKQAGAVSSQGLHPAMHAGPLPGPASKTVGGVATQTYCRQSDAIPQSKWPLACVRQRGSNGGVPAARVSGVSA